MARSRSPSGDVTSGTASTLSASCALSVASGRRCSPLGNTTPIEGSKAIRRCEASQAKKPFTGDDPLSLGAKRQRGAVALFVMVEVTLIGLQSGEGDLGRISDAQFGEEGGQRSEVASPARHRPFGIAVGAQPGQVVLDRPA